MGKYKFSIVIALAPNREAEIVKSLKKINYGKNNFEIIIERGRNPSKNRNKGTKKAKGEIVVFLDDDAIIDKNILKNAEKFFNKYPQIDIVGGPQLTPKDEKGFAKISGYALSCKFGAWKISNRYSGEKLILNADETMLTSANMFCKKKVFEKIRFNPLLYPGEDPDFIARAIKEGFKIAYCPEIIVYHRRRSNLLKLMKQIYYYGKTRPKKESLKETLKMPFFIVPSIFLVYLVFLLLFLIFKTNSSSLKLIILTPLLIYFILNLSFSLANSITNKDFFAIFLLPFIYFAIHLSYGLGFLISTLKNIFKKRN